MLKRSITYEDLSGEKLTEDFYFNMSKPELIEMEVEVDGGFAALLQTIIRTENTKELIGQFKRIILMSYGEKSEDGKRFIKSEELSKAFSQTDAYSVLFMELATDDKVAAAFLTAILPGDMRGEMTKAIEEVGAPTAPAAPTPPLPPTT